MACDIPAHAYAFSFDPGYEFTEKCACGAEILGYIRGLFEKYDLRKHVKFNTVLRTATFDRDTGLWTCELESSAGPDQVFEDQNGHSSPRSAEAKDAMQESITGSVLFTAVGQLNKPRVPKLPGIASFKGDAFHTARWRGDVSLEGKRVAVVGTGASAVQTVPAIAPKVEKLYVLQRSPGWIAPRPDYGYSPVMRAIFRYVPLVQVLHRFYFYGLMDVLFLMIGPNNQDGAHRTATNKYLSSEVLSQMRAQLEGDEVLVASALPDPDKEVIGCKRLLFSNHWFPALRRPNVELVSEAVAGVHPTGLTTASGRKIEDLDVIIWSTGFDTGHFLPGMHIGARNGGKPDADLQALWSSGRPGTYYCFGVPDVPNLCVLYGPNMNTNHTSVNYFHERTCEAAVRVLTHTIRSGNKTIEVRKDVYDRYMDWLDDRLDHSAFVSGCGSWYVHMVNGKPRSPTTGRAHGSTLAGVARLCLRVTL